MFSFSKFAGRVGCDTHLGADNFKDEINEYLAPSAYFVSKHINSLLLSSKLHIYVLYDKLSTCFLIYAFSLQVPTRFYFQSILLTLHLNPYHNKYVVRGYSHLQSDLSAHTICYI